MHPSALHYGRLFFKAYSSNLPGNAKVVDIGAQNVNGSLKDVCPAEYQYIGVDFVEGKGVDVILNDPYTLPFDSESIDAVVCSSCFEHSEMFWLVFTEILRVLKPTGLLYLNAPSNGYVHRYPVDCWRFYPDAGHALVTWAKRNGYSPVLLESFTGQKSSKEEDGAWNDFISVFAKSERSENTFNSKITDQLEAFENARVAGSSELKNFQAYPEDFRLIEHLRDQQHALEAQAQAQALESRQEVARLQTSLKYSDTALEVANKELRALRLQLIKAGEHNRVTSANFETIIQSLQQSTSWKVTAPLRLASRAIRGQRPLVAGGLRARIVNAIKPLYWSLPPKYRNRILQWGYRNFEIVFRGTAHYEFWKHGSARQPQHSGDIVDNSLILMETVPPVEEIEGRIAIHLHMYYHDLAGEFVEYLKQMPFAYDLYISTKDQEGAQACKIAFSDLPSCESIVIETVQNRGRDIAPMFCTFGDALKRYDYIAHLHSKKSLYNAGATEGWRQYLAGNLLGSSTTIRKVFSLLLNGRGIVYPQNYKLLPHQANTWLANKGMGSAWCTRLGISPVPQGYFDFPAGSMFWARGDALRPLFDAGITINDFAEEAGQTDGTFAHCLERLLVLTAKKQGLPAGIIKDLESPSWSAWRMDQSIGRPFPSMVDQFKNPQIKYIAFDIFDTLVMRPLLDAESIKAIVKANLPEPLGHMYAEYRAVSEGEARQKKGKDVGLDEIFERFQQMTRLSSEEIELIRATEERIEYESLSVRSGGLELFEQAKGTKKPVVLISDMFLPKDLIIKALNKHGIQDWSAFFLSNEVGLRKDTGELYDHVLTTYGLQPNELIMVGDNERSDFQIPCDKGVVGLHVLRAVEIARGTPRLRSFVEKYEFSDNLNAELTLGLIFSKNFAPVVYPSHNAGSLFEATPYNLGYSLIGPMLTSMSQWLIDTAKKDNIDHLYFLAREGELMKAVYDAWTKGQNNVPDAHYLIVSRRTCSVPLIKTFDDILQIAQSDYHLNTAENFLTERYGLELNEEEWEATLRASMIGQTTLVEVHQKNLDDIMPLLRHVADAIFKQATTEYESLSLYLNSMGLMSERRSAAVDVGYGGTIQGYLCKLTGKKIGGYYLATDVRSIDVAKENDILIRGCLLENVARDHTAPMLYLRSFELEKLLSSSSAQIMKYTSANGVDVVAHHRELSTQEMACIEFREELQKGVLQFVQEAAHIRKTLLEHYSPPLEVSKALATEFFSKHSSAESDLLAQVVLDDHYCGRGVV